MHVFIRIQSFHLRGIALKIHPLPLVLLVAVLFGGLAASSAAVTCYPRTTDAVAAETPAQTLYTHVYYGAYGGSFARGYFVEVWGEENGLVGLQKSATHCSDGSSVPADHLYSSVGVPDPRVIYL